MAKTRNEAYLIGIFTIIITAAFFIELVIIGGALGSSLLAALGMGLFTALLGMASYRYRRHLQRKAFVGKKQASEDLSSQQERSIEIDLPYDAAFDLALEALQTLHRQDVPQPEPDSFLMKLETWVPRKQLLRLRKQDRSTGLIQAGLRSKVFGLDNVLDFSQIDMQVERIDSGTTRIVISSKPATLSEYYDLGKNLHYVNSLARYMRRENAMQGAETRLSDSSAAVADDDLLAADEREQHMQQ